MSFLKLLRNSFFEQILIIKYGTCGPGIPTGAELLTYIH
jgi:hypothetical protein